ncbi:S-layer homology domain-containing protein [Paenibacillus agaridevorans]|uniref:S-layer homology domain-containing protein n=1 Tax=Paenibacillus agaridevorans TaxID=171404 RepID=UPI001BE3CFE8|nr:S-layer homology domain-containing protein [Paenibacillus agaridevorans]
MKRKLMIWLVSLLLCVTMPGMAGAADKPQFRMSVTTEGDEVIAIISASGLTDLYGFELQVSYDPLRMKFLKSESSFTGFSVPPLVKGGNLTLAHTKIGPVTGVSGEAELATLRFDRVGGGEAVFRLEEASLVDSQVQMLSYKPGIAEIAEGGERGVKLVDIGGHWGENDIAEAVELGWVTGYSDGTFRPDKSINRAEYAVMLARALGLTSAEEQVFSDSGQLPSWSRPYISGVAAAGIVNGYSDGLFRPERLVTREEMTAMIVRAAAPKVEVGGEPTFADSAQIAAWAKPYVQAAADAGLVKGKGGNRFMPADSATRAEAATMILNLLRLLRV